MALSIRTSYTITQQHTGTAHEPTIVAPHASHITVAILPYSWDRIPYLTEQRLGAGHPSLIQHENFIHHNALFNSYSSFCQCSLTPDLHSLTVTGAARA